MTDLRMKIQFKGWAWWCAPLMQALGRQRQADLRALDKPGLQCEFPDSQDYYTEKPCFETLEEEKKGKSAFKCLRVSIATAKHHD